jgi:hypothetical protein
MMRCCERASTVLIGNKGLEDWGSVLGDEVTAAAHVNGSCTNATSSPSEAIATGSDSNATSGSTANPTNTKPPEPVVSTSTEACHLPPELDIVSYRKADIFSRR